MQTKIEFTLETTDLEDLLPDLQEYDNEDAGHRHKLVERLIAKMEFPPQLGGWSCKVTTVKDGLKVAGKLIPPGGTVLG